MQGSTGHRHIPSLTRRSQQRKNSFSFPTANGSNFLMIFYNGECQWNITRPTGYSFNIVASKAALLEWKQNDIHKPFGRSAEREGMQWNKGQGRTVSSINQKHMICPLLWRDLLYSRKPCKVLWGAIETLPVRSLHCKEQRPSQVTPGKGLF